MNQAKTSEKYQDLKYSNYKEGNNIKYWNKFWGNQKSDLDEMATNYHLIREYKLIESIVNNLGLNSSVCEIGCGKSMFLLHLLEKRPDIKIYGIDISEIAVNYSKKQGVIAILGDITKKLPFPDNMFDLVFSFGTIEHFNKDIIKHICNEHFRVSKKFVMISTPSKYTFNHFEWFISNKIINNRSDKDILKIDGMLYSPHEIEHFCGRKAIHKNKTGRCLPFNRYTNFIEIIIFKKLIDLFGASSYCIFKKK